MASALWMCRLALPPRDRDNDDLLGLIGNFTKSFEEFQLDLGQSYRIFEAAVADLDAQLTLEQLGSMARFPLASYVDTLKPRSVKYIPPFLSDVGKRLLRESIPVSALGPILFLPTKRAWQAA